MKKINILTLIALAITCMICFTACNNQVIHMCNEKATIAVGERVTLFVTLDPADAEVKWSSSDNKIATVSNGEVRALSVGKVTITAKANNKSAKCKITVTKKPISVSLDKGSLDIKTGEVVEAILKVRNGDGETVNWQVENSAIASINKTTDMVENKVSKVNVHGVAVGETTITASVDGEDYVIKVSVNENIEIKILPIVEKGKVIMMGEKYNLSCEVLKNDKVVSSENIVWESNDTAIATITAKELTALKNGTTKITATYDNKNKATAIINVFKGVTNKAEFEAINDNLKGNYVLLNSIDFMVNNVKGEVASIAPYEKTKVVPGSPSSNKNRYFPTENMFEGIFDGAGYTMSNFIPKEMVGTSLKSNTLFGVVANNAIVRNTSFIGVEGSRQFGIVKWNEGIVENIYSEILITGVSGTNKNNPHAGVVVKNQTKRVEGTYKRTIDGVEETFDIAGTKVGGRIRNCISKVSIKAEVDIGADIKVVGGIVGFNGGGDNVIENCYGFSLANLKAINLGVGAGQLVGTVGKNVKQVITEAALIAEDYSSFDTDIWTIETGFIPKLKHMA